MVVMAGGAYRPVERLGHKVAERVVLCIIQTG